MTPPPPARKKATAPPPARKAPPPARKATPPASTPPVARKRATPPVVTPPVDLRCPRCGGPLEGEAFYGPCATCRQGLRNGTPPPTPPTVTPARGTLAMGPDDEPIHMLIERKADKTLVVVRTGCGKAGSPYMYQKAGDKAMTGIRSSGFGSNVTCPDCLARFDRGSILDIP